MTDIEERAIDAAMDWTYTELDAGTIIEEHTQNEYKAYKQGFTDGIKDQQKVDIENFKKLLKMQVLYKALTEESMDVIIDNLNSIQNGDM